MLKSNRILILLAVLFGASACKVQLSKDPNAVASSTPVAVASATPILTTPTSSDVTAPTAPSITAGAYYNSKALTSVNLGIDVSLSATETESTPMQMCVGVSGDCSVCTWEAYATSKTITVPDASATLNLSVKFRDSVGNVSACAATTSVYEQISIESSIAPAVLWTDWTSFASPVNKNTCSGGETPTNNELPCLHAAELLKVTTPYTACANLVMTDDAGVFDWRCLVESGLATFYSSLKPDKGAANLIDFVNYKFLPFSVSVTDGATTKTSYARVYWTNVIADPSDQGVAVGETDHSYALNTDGTVYIIGDNLTVAQIAATSSNVALVVAPGKLVTSTAANNNCGAGNCGVRASSQFAYLEGAFTFPGKHVLGVEGANYIRVHNFRVKDGEMNVSNSSYGAFSGLNFAMRASLKFSGGEQHRIWNSKFSNNYSAAALFLDILKKTTVASSYFANNTGYGIYLDNAEDNHLNGLSFTNGKVTSLAVVNQSVNLDIVNVADFNFNNTDYSIDISNSNSIFGLNLMVDSNFQLSGTDGNQFTQGLYFTGSAACNVSGSAEGVNDGSYGAVVACGAVDASDHIVYENIDLSAAVVGKVTVDTANTSDTLGLVDFGLASWFDFDNWSRLFGLDGSAFPSGDHRNRCQVGDNCRIWDWAVRNTDTKLRGAAIPSQSIDPVITADVACPTYFKGDRHVTIQRDGTKFLVAATEVMYDGIGNDNGFCEDLEACIYAPNLGAYQGHGPLRSCAYDDAGSIRSAGAYGYATNGY